MLVLLNLLSRHSLQLFGVNYFQVVKLKTNIYFQQLIVFSSHASISFSQLIYSTVCISPENRILNTQSQSYCNTYWIVTQIRIGRCTRCSNWCRHHDTIKLKKTLPIVKDKRVAYITCYTTLSNLEHRCKIPDKIWTDSSRV